MEKYRQSTAKAVKTKNNAALLRLLAKLAMLALLAVPASQTVPAMLALLALPAMPALSALPVLLGIAGIAGIANIACNTSIDSNVGWHCRHCLGERGCWVMEAMSFVKP